MKRLLTLTAAVALTVAAGFLIYPLLAPSPAPAPAAQPAPQPVAAAPAPTATTDPTSHFMAVIADTPANAFYVALRTHYPSEAQTLLTADAPTSAQAFERITTLASDLSKILAENLKSAPDDTLQALLAARANTISAFEDAPMVCNRVIVSGGPFALSADEAARVANIGANIDVLFRALAEGGQSEAAGLNPTGTDLARLSAAFTAAGGAPEDWALVMKPQGDDPRLCGAMLTFLRVLAEAEFEGAPVLRAAISVALHSG